MNVTNLCIIILILACVSILIYLLYRIKKDGLRAVTVELIVYAEKKFGSKKGQEKMAFVIDALTKQIPAPFNLLINEETIMSFAQSVFDLVKNALDYRPIDEENK